MGASTSGMANQKSASFGAFELSTMKQIEHITSDLPRLVRRTQSKRSSYKVLGQTLDTGNEDTDEDSDVNENIVSVAKTAKHNEQYDYEIFDDDDFYHNLLRELIEQKSGANQNEPCQHRDRLSFDFWLILIEY